MTRPEFPIVSVVMPAYNAERWIARAIESVLGQTLPRWELIVIDDGSQDDTVAVARGFDDPRIRVINQENLGASSARNRGIADARGRYISLLDADDWYAPDHLEKTTAFLDRQPECGLVGTNFFFVNEDGCARPRFGAGEIFQGTTSTVIPDFFEFATRHRCFPVTCGTVFPRRTPDELGGFDESLESFEDQELHLRWAMSTRFGYIAQPLGYYSVDTPSSRRKDIEGGIGMRIRLWHKLTEREPTINRDGASFARARSYYLFRLTALTIATGHLEYLAGIASVWPASPQHTRWWAGKALMSLPSPCQALIHGFARRRGLVSRRYHGAPEGSRS